MINTDNMVEDGCVCVHIHGPAVCVCVCGSSTPPPHIALSTKTKQPPLRVTSWALSHHLALLQRSALE